MKIIFLCFTMISAPLFGQNKSVPRNTETEFYVRSVNNLTLTAASELANRVTLKASSIHRKIAVAILDASGNILLITRGDGVGSHNTEAARRKAFTALSTKTPTLTLLRNAAQNPDTANLNSLPELLLLSGGTPVWFKGEVIGSIGVAGGGSAENDDVLAKSGEIREIGITTTP